MLVRVVLGCCALTRLSRAAQLVQFTSLTLIFVSPLSPHGRGSKALQNGCGCRAARVSGCSRPGAQASAVVEVDRRAAVSEGGHQQKKLPNYLTLVFAPESLRRLAARCRGTCRQKHQCAGDRASKSEFRCRPRAAPGRPFVGSNKGSPQALVL